MLFHRPRGQGVHHDAAESQGGYALLILAFLYHRSEGGCAREIADRFGVSRAFVANILKVLCGKGLQVAKRLTRLARWPEGCVRSSR